MKVTHKQKVGPAMWVIQCPLCARELASASEEMYLPDFMLCNCDKNGNKQPVYELFERDGKTMIRRNKAPRFIGEITFGPVSDIENIEMIDGPVDPIELTKALRKAGEFLIKSK